MKVFPPTPDMGFLRQRDREHHGIVKVSGNNRHRSTPQQTQSMHMALFALDIERMRHVRALHVRLAPKQEGPSVTAANHCQIDVK